MDEPTRPNDPAPLRPPTGLGSGVTRPRMQRPGPLPSRPGPDVPRRLDPTSRLPDWASRLPHWASRLADWASRLSHWASPFGEQLRERIPMLTGQLRAALRRALADGRLRWLGAVAGLGLAVAFLLVLMPDRPAIRTIAPPAEQPVASASPESTAATAAERAATITFTAPSSWATEEVPRWVATLEEVKESLRIAYRGVGITSEAILHTMALDRTQQTYRTVIARARERAASGGHRAALSMLAAALEEMDPQHLSGRIALIKTMIKLAREGGLFEDMERYRTALGEVAKDLRDAMVKAAREGGLPADQVDAVFRTIEGRKDGEKKVDRFTDMLSGRDVEKEGS